MESSVCRTPSSSSSSSSPSIGFGSTNESTNDLMTLANEQLKSGDLVHAITRLNGFIENKLSIYKTKTNTNTNTNTNTTNNNNINNFNFNTNLKGNTTTDQMTTNTNNTTNTAKELSKLYAIRGECYLKLGLHQLAFDDCVNASQLDTTNANCYYIKGKALLGLKQKESAEQSFEMALQLSKTYSETSEDLVRMRFEALKEAGFDEETANKFAPKSRSVNEAIDHILSTSLTSDQLSNLRDSYTRSLTNSTKQLPTHPPNESQFLSMSGIFGNKNLNNINGSNANRGSESLGLQLISDIDNCLVGILDSDEEKANILDEKIDNNINSMNAMNITNNNNFNISNNSQFCDMGDNNLQISRSLSQSPQNPQTAQNPFGISTDPQLKQKANNFSNYNNFSIDLNKESLGSQIIAKANHYSSNGANSSTSAEPPRKTFADIASANTKKPIQPLKQSTNFNAKTATNGKVSEKMDTKDIFSLRSQKVFDSGNKVSSLESFGSPNGESLEKLEKMSQIVVSEPNRPTNIMAYKGLWVCNISPEASYITLKKVFRKYGNFTGIQTFERKATNGSNIVFVHYDNSQAPIDAIADLFGVFRKDICFDENTPLKLRFTPSMEQTKIGDLPSMEKAKRVVEKSGECFNWRLSTGCHKGERCLFKHININKSIDSQPWVKALKKKANET